MEREHIRILGVVRVWGIWIGLLVPAIGICAGTHDHTDRETLLAQAQSALEEGEYTVAEDACRRALAAAPDIECYARLMLSDIYGTQGLFEQALEQARKARQAAATEPVDTEGGEAAGKAIEFLTRAEERVNVASTQLRETLASKMEPEAMAVASGRLADHLLVAGRTEDVLSAYSAAVAGYVDAVAKRHERAPVMARQLGRLALAYRLQGVEARTGSAIFSDAEGLAEALDLRRAKRYALAAESCRRAITELPEHQHEGRLLLAEIYSLQGQFPHACRQALDAQAKALDDPEDATLSFEAVSAAIRFVHADVRLDGSAVALLEDEGTDAAITLYQATVAEYADRAAVARFALGRLEKLYADRPAMGDVRSGEDVFAGVEALASAVAHKRANDYASAAAASRHVIATSPEHGHEARLLLAELYYLQADLERASGEALAAFEQAVAERADPRHVIQAGRAVVRYAEQRNLEREKEGTEGELRVH